LTETAAIDQADLHRRYRRTDNCLAGGFGDPGNAVAPDN
jgi:hypothetical protein